MSSCMFTTLERTHSPLSSEPRTPTSLAVWGLAPGGPFSPQREGPLLVGSPRLLSALHGCQAERGLALLVTGLPAASHPPPRASPGSSRAEPSLPPRARGGKGTLLPGEQPFLAGPWPLPATVVPVPGVSLWEGSQALYLGCGELVAV